jgi:DNA-directed RNA polymerase subunit RPC12/RpoP
MSVRIKYDENESTEPKPCAKCGKEITKDMESEDYWYLDIYVTRAGQSSTCEQMSYICRECLPAFKKELHKIVPYYGVDEWRV